MILLIQELQEKYDLLDENLNSIMILLIPDKLITNQTACTVNLNSIMILLIPVPKSSPYLSQKTSLFCRPLQNSTFLSCP